MTLVTASSAPLEPLLALGSIPVPPPASALEGGPARGAPPDGSCPPLDADERILRDAGVVPALLACSTTDCRELVRWFERVAATTGAPLVRLDVPSQDRPEDVRYVRRQLERLVETAALAFGTTLDGALLEEAVALSARAEAAWGRFRALGACHPAPFDAYFDGFELAGVLVVLRGRRVAVEVLEAAADAFEVVAAAAHGPVARERLRVVIEGPLPGPELALLRRALAGRGVVAVGARWTCYGGVGVDPGTRDPDPLDAVARRLIRERRASPSLLVRPDRLAALVHDVDATALLVAPAPTCRAAGAGCPPSPAPEPAPARPLPRDVRVLFLEGERLVAGELDPTGPGLAELDRLLGGR